MDSGHPNPKRTIPLALALLGLIGVLVFVITGIVIGESYRRGLDVARDMGNRLFGNLLTDIAVQQHQMVQPIEFALTILGVDPALSGGRAADLRESMLAVLPDNPQITELRVAYASGELFAVVRLDGPGGRLRTAADAPPEAIYATKHIRSGREGWQTTWSYLDNARQPLGEKSSAVSAPPHNEAEPWYAAATPTPGTIVQTKTAAISGQQAVGMSFATAFGGAHSGVVAADVSLARLSEILKYLKFDDEDQLFLFDDHDMLVAAADVDVTHDVDGTTMQNGIAQLAHPIVRVMLDRFRSGGTYASETLRAGSTEFLASVIRLDDEIEGRPKLYLAFATPAATFTGGFVDISRKTALISLLIMIAATPFIVWVTRRFARPLKALEHVTDAIARLDMDQPITQDTRIREISRLGHSIDDMRNALGQVAKFVPKALVQDLMRSRDDISVGGVRRELSYMFTDVRDFTPMAESMLAEDLMLQMSAYFDALVGEVLSCRGTVDKYVGDAIFAFWNAPTQQTDHVDLACKTALACRAASNALNAQWRKDGRPEWYTRFGVHVGEAVVGNVGSRDRLDYTAIGSAVNMAARLEGLNKFYETQILVSEGVKERVGGAFLFRSIDRVLAKGSSVPMTVYELICDRDAASAEIIARHEAWEAAYSLYKKSEWRSALAAIEKLMESTGNDRVVARFHQRIAEILGAPPPETWGGVTRFDSK